MFNQPRTHHDTHMKCIRLRLNDHVELQFAVDDLSILNIKPRKHIPAEESCTRYRKIRINYEEKKCSFLSNASVQIN